MIIKWNQFINEAEVEQDLEKRTQQLINIRNKVQEIMNAGNSINGLNEAEAIETQLQQMIDKYQGDDDSAISTALTYLKTIADKRSIELRIVDYQERIPELQNQLKNEIDRIGNDIEQLRLNSESTPETT
jgi:hypothetical protein